MKRLFLALLLLLASPAFAAQPSSSSTFPDVTRPVPYSVAIGGTNAITASAALSNLAGNPATGSYGITCSSSSSCTAAAGFAPSGDATSNATGVFTNVGLNGTLLSGLSTGLLKITTGTGAVSIAAGSDVASLLSATSPIALSGGGAISIANAAADGATLGAAAFNATNFSASSGVVNTIQGISTAATPQFTRLGLGQAADATALIAETQAPAANTSVDGIILQDTTTASASNQQYSPRIRLTGQGWKTTATAASQAVDFIIENEPVQDAANPDPVLFIKSQTNGGGYTTVAALGSVGAGSASFGAKDTMQINGALDMAGSIDNTGGGCNGFCFGYYASNYGWIQTFNALPLTINAKGNAVAIGSSAIATGAKLTITGGPLAFGTSTYISNPAAATLHMGVADAASPVAQTLGVQGVVAGTSNTAGVNWTFAASQSTGTGAGGSLIFQTAPAGGSGTAQNAEVAALTINSAQTSTFNGIIVRKGYTVSTLPASPGTGAFAYVTDAVACTFLATLTGGGSAWCPVGYNGSAWVGE